MAIIFRMAKHSVADAKNHLSDLIDRALKGEEVVITRHGHPVAELKAISATVRAVTPEDLAWLDAHRVGKKMPKQDAGALLRTMRDEEQR